MSTRILSLAAVVAVAVGGCGDGNEPSNAVATATPAMVQLESAYNRVVKKVSPSVVQITTDEGLGSGVVLDDRGNIVTNAHVVGDAQASEVTLASGKQVSASLVGRWAPGDLAAIHVDAAGLSR